MSGSDVGDAISENWTRELGDSRDVESLDELQVAAIRRRNSVVDPQVEALNISGPEETSTFLTIERGGSTVADTQNVSVLLRSVGDKRELRVSASRTTELEDMSLVLDDVDVDVSAAKRHDTCAGVYGVLVLGNLDHGIKLVWAHLVASEIVEIEPVRFATLACDYAHTGNILTFEHVRGQEFKRTGSQILVRAIELCLFPRHEEIDWRDLTIRSDGKIYSGLFETGRRLTAGKRVASSFELRCIAVTAGKEHTSLAVVGETTTRHPNTRTGNRVWLGTAFHSPGFNDSACSAVETDDSSSEVPFDTVGSPACVDEVSDLKHTRTSVLVTANEHTVGVVAELESVDQPWEAVDLRQIGSVDGVEVVATVETTGRAGLGKSTVLEGITVGLRGEVPNASIRIDDTSSRDTDRGVDVDAAIKISSQEGYVHVP